MKKTARKTTMAFMLGGGGKGGSLLVADGGQQLSLDGAAGGRAGDGDGDNGGVRGVGAMSTALLAEYPMASPTDALHDLLKVRSIVRLLVVGLSFDCSCFVVV
jgi:hypothetical protein